jgi:arginyl-tRNA synthetase
VKTDSKATTKVQPAQSFVKQNPQNIFTFARKSNMEENKKTMTDVKVELVEITVNSPVAVNFTTEEIIDLLEKSADFVFKYNPKKCGAE